LLFLKPLGTFINMRQNESRVKLFSTRNGTFPQLLSALFSGSLRGLGRGSFVDKTTPQGAVSGRQLQNHAVVGGQPQGIFAGAP
jgi:hypothetical protein